MHFWERAWGGGGGLYERIIIDMIGYQVCPKWRAIKATVLYCVWLWGYKYNRNDKLIRYEYILATIMPESARPQDYTSYRPRAAKMFIIWVIPRFSNSPILIWGCPNFLTLFRYKSWQSCSRCRWFTSPYPQNMHDASTTIDQDSRSISSVSRQCHVRKPVKLM